MKAFVTILAVLVITCCGGKGGGGEELDADSDADGVDTGTDAIEEDAGGDELPSVPGDNPADPDIPSDDLSGGPPPAAGTCSYQGLDEMCRRRDLAAVKPFEAVIGPDGWSQPETLVFQDTTTGAEIFRLTDDPAGNVIHCHINRTTFNADGSMLSFGSRRCWPGYYCPDNFRYVVETHGRGPRIISVPPEHMLYTGPWEAWSPTDPGVFHMVNHGAASGLWRVEVNDGAFDTTRVMDLPDTDRRKDIFGGVAPDGTLAVRTTALSEGTQVNVYIWDPSRPTDLVTFDLDLGVEHPDHSASEEWHVHDFTLRRNAENTIIFNYGPQGSVGEPFFVEVASDGTKGWRVGFARNEDTHCPVPYYSHPAFSGDGTMVLYGGVREKFVDGTNPDGSPLWTWNDSDWGSFIHEISPFDPTGDYSTSTLVARVAELDLGIGHYAWDGYDDRWAHGAASSELGDGTPLYRLATDGSLAEPVVYTFARSHCGGSCDYCSLARPAQSPDATKVVYASDMLQAAPNAEDVYMAVHRYPYAPVWLGLASTTDLEIVWRLHPLSREVGGVRVLRSADETPFAFEDVSGIVAADGFVDTFEIPLGGSILYAATAVEHSGLESRVLSRVIRVTREGSGYRVDQVVPYGTAGFDTASPAAPTGLAATPGTGGTLLEWTAPAGGDVRLFNVYASPAGEPDITQAFRIASLPAGFDSFLDWSAGTAILRYAVTAVDYQGNESDPARD